MAPLHVPVRILWTAVVEMSWPNGMVDISQFFLSGLTHQMGTKQVYSTPYWRMSPSNNVGMMLFFYHGIRMLNIYLKGTIAIMF